MTKAAGFASDMVEESGVVLMAVGIRRNLEDCARNMAEELVVNLKDVLGAVKEMVYVDHMVEETGVWLMDAIKRIDGQDFVSIMEQIDNVELKTAIKRDEMKDIAALILLKLSIERYTVLDCLPRRLYQTLHRSARTNLKIVIL